MDKERNLGVTEARFALTILTCLLVAIGYIALLRLGGTKDMSQDVTPEDISLPSIADTETLPPTKAEAQPRVLPLDNPDDSHTDSDSLAKRPTPSQKSTEPERR